MPDANRLNASTKPLTAYPLPSPFAKSPPGRRDSPLHHHLLSAKRPCRNPRCVSMYGGPLWKYQNR